jgi:uncharacterized protein (TIGR00288 family)
MNEQEQRSEHSLAVFIDFENLALGFKDRRERFDIQLVLKRLVEKGKIVSKKAYADWNRYHIYTEALHEAAIELIEIPRRIQSGKNSADIRLVVDAMDLSYSKDHIDTFVVVSGDSDFSPLVSKLKELGKHVIGCGMQESTSELLRDNCDEFIYYEDLGDDVPELPAMAPHVPETKKKVFALLYEALLALRRENKEVLWSSMVKDTIKRKKPSFNETYYGYQTFSDLLQDAAKEGLIEVEKHKRSGTYVVTRFGEEMRRLPRRRPSELDDLEGPEGTLERPRGDRRRRPTRRDRPELGHRPERMDRPERIETPLPLPLPLPVDRSLPPLEPERPERPERVERTDNRDPRERSSRSRGGRSRTAAPRTDRPERREPVERSDRPERREPPLERSDRAERTSRPMRTYDVERELPPLESDTAPVAAGPRMPPPLPPMMEPPPPPPPPSTMAPPAAPTRSFGAGIFDE